ncbi:hypothetical protein EXIGLDRAFT_729386 [Exidia glandulosa HHB12029]|uniref:Uncharacterized protein n=1 Tax=Exidia glandulosa HHB12029 TaxID=1314781 RepID=A0A165CKM6_EXIGL|nr:hypothetical protein EXIGLDRAFT_729386 [Exidia glandulosa HHB12029]
MRSHTQPTHSSSTTSSTGSCARGHNAGFTLKSGADAFAAGFLAGGFHPFPSCHNFSRTPNHCACACVRSLPLDAQSMSNFFSAFGLLKEISPLSSRRAC